MFFFHDTSGFKRFIFFAFALLFFQTSIAQPYFDLAGYSYLNSPLSRQGNKPLSNLSFHNAFLNIPVRSDSAITIFSSGYDHLNVSVKDKENYGVHSVRLSVNRVQKWKKGRQGILVLNFRSNSDQELFRLENYQWGGAFIYSKRKSDRFRYSFGLYYNREFFGNFFVPLFGLNCRINEKWNVYGLLPNNMYLNFHALKHVHTGVMISFITSSYRLNLMKYIRFNENQFKVYFNYVIGKSNVLLLEAGHSLFRNCEIGTGFSSSSGERDLNVSDGFMLKAGYVFRIYE